MVTSPGPPPAGGEPAVPAPAPAIGQSAQGPGPQQPPGPTTQQRAEPREPEREPGRETEQITQRLTALQAAGLPAADLLALIRLLEDEAAANGPALLWLVLQEPDYARLLRPFASLYRKWVFTREAAQGLLRLIWAREQPSQTLWTGLLTALAELFRLDAALRQAWNQLMLTCSAIAAQPPMRAFYRAELYRQRWTQRAAPVARRIERARIT